MGDPFATLNHHQDLRLAEIIKLPPRIFDDVRQGERGGTPRGHTCGTTRVTQKKIAASDVVSLDTGLSHARKPLHNPSKLAKTIVRIAMNLDTGPKIAPGTLRTKTTVNAYSLR